MKATSQDIAILWRGYWSFRLALLYLACLCLLVILLPLLPLPFTPNQMDLNSIFLRPFEDNRHLFGTDQLGRDVLVNVLYGARNGLAIAIPVMLISTVLGTGIGALAGYFGNSKLYLTRSFLIILIGCLFILSYYVVYVPLQVIKFELPEHILYTSITTGIAICILSYLSIRPVLSHFSLFRVQVALPVDSIMLRTIELVTSLPKLLILICVAAFAPPSVMLLSLIFICTYWTGIARLTRAEMLRIKHLPYMEAAISTGMKPMRIIYREAAPNLFSPVVVAFIFGIGGLLAIESTLSFLSIGLPANFPSWGRTIAGFRSNMTAWWLVVFPGGFLALTVLALQVCSYHLMHLAQQRAKH